MSNYLRILWKILYQLGLTVERRHIDKALKELKQHDNMTVDQLHKYQLKKMKDMLIYMQENIPYYQRLFREYDFEAEKFQSFDDLKLLPYMDKEVVKAHSEELMNPLYEKMKIERKTGGSTGNKLKVYYEPRSLDITAAVVARCLEWAGKKIGDSEVHFSSNVNTHISWKDAWKERAKCLALHRKNIVLDIFDDKTFDVVLDELKKIRPLVVQGFPSIAYALAGYAKKQKREVKGLFKVYESTGETLYDFQRELIEDVFSCQIYNRYGDAEFGVIAYECAQHQGLHVQSDVVYVETPEFMKDGHAVHEVVVTSLTNKMMPLLRYRTGDLGLVTDEPCLCGRPYPRIINMQGRVHDFIHVSDDIVLSTTYLLDLFDHYGGFNDFQVQYRENVLHFYVLSEDGMTLDKLQGFQQELYEAIHKKARVDIHLVERLKVLPSGKFRYIVGDNVVYNMSSNRQVLSEGEAGIIESEPECMKFPIIGNIMCMEGFYDVESTAEGYFIWMKCRGKIQLLKPMEGYEFLSLSSKTRCFRIYSDDGSVDEKTDLKEGWQQYMLNLPANKILSFEISEAIEKSAVSNDPRELALGMREIKKNGE